MGSGIRRAYRILPKDGDCFFDVGANIGVYTLFASQLRPHSRIVALEPEWQNFAALNGNLYLNQVRNVRALPVALSNRDAISQLNLHNFSSGAALHSLSPLEDSSFQQGIPCMRLQTLCDTFGADVPNLLKVDIDGHEEEFFEGARSVLASPKLRTILIELTGNPQGMTEWIQRFESLGFKLKKQGRPSRQASGKYSQNHIFHRPAVGRDAL